MQTSPSSMLTKCPRKPFRAALAAGSALFLAALAAAPVAAQSAKPDQLVVLRANGATRTLSGTVQEYSLEGVKIDISDRSQRFDADKVLRVSYGDVPKNYADAVVYAGRGEWEPAAARFKLVAGDASARDLVRAAARLRSAEAMMRLGANDASFFQEAYDAAGTFLGDYATNLEVPRARVVQARAMLLNGDAAGAATLFAALAGELVSGVPTPGYGIETTAEAGLSAARAYLAAGDTIKAREAYSALKSNVTAALQNTDDTELEARLTQLLERADLGEGWILLASDNANGAKSYFEGELSRNPDSSSALRFGALLGLGESLLALGDTASAQLALAKVAALDPVDRDRAARAQIGLARCALAQADTKSQQRARAAAQSVLNRYGDTPSLAAAQEILSQLK